MAFQIYRRLVTISTSIRPLEQQFLSCPVTHLHPFLEDVNPLRCPPSLIHQPLPMPCPRPASKITRPTPMKAASTFAADLRTPKGTFPQARRPTNYPTAPATRTKEKNRAVVAKICRKRREKEECCSRKPKRTSWNVVSDSKDTYQHQNENILQVSFVWRPRRSRFGFKITGS